MTMVGRGGRGVVAGVCGRVVGLVVLVAVGCAVNPVTRRPELAMVSRSTELEIGTEQAKTVAADMGLLDDAAIAAYVRAIGVRLATRSPRTDVPYAFHVVDTPEPNAFAIPGHVYVTRGLLVLLNDEDELAGVLAHEVGHIAARHAVQRLSRALPAGIVTGIVSGVTGLASPLLGSLFQAGGDFATDALLAPYSREQEREADRVGQEIAAAAGWDPAALARALATLERFEATEKHEQRRPSFLDSHPSTPERARNTAAYAATLVRVAAAPIVSSRDEFFVRLDGLVVGPSAAQGVFDDTTFLHPDMGFRLHFPKGWKTANGATQVAGLAADGRTVAVLSLAADGNDPMLGVRAFERTIEEPVSPRVERTTIEGLSAAHLGAATQSEGRRIAVEVWWIAFADHVFQLIGLATGPSPDDERPTLASIATSFGPLTPAERAKIREDHLRLIEPRSGDTLATFTHRTGTTWSTDLVAIANALPAGAVPLSGVPLKVAVREPYRGKSQ